MSMNYLVEHLAPAKTWPDGPMERAQRWNRSSRMAAAAYVHIIRRVFLPKAERGAIK